MRLWMGTRKVVVAVPCSLSINCFFPLNFDFEALIYFADMLTRDYKTLRADRQVGS